MKLDAGDIYPLVVLTLSLALALITPIIRDNEILRIGWAIIHTIIAVGYITGLFILKAIQELREEIK